MLQAEGDRLRRAQRLQQDVGARRQIEHRVPAVGRSQVDLDTARAAVPHHLARPVRTAAGCLHADYVGAVVRQQHRRDRPGDAGAEVQHPDPVEDARHRISISSGRPTASELAEGAGAPDEDGSHHAAQRHAGHHKGDGGDLGVEAVRPVVVEGRAHHLGGR